MELFKLLLIKDNVKAGHSTAWLAQGEALEAFWALHLLPKLAYGPIIEASFRLVTVFFLSIFSLVYVDIFTGLTIDDNLWRLLPARIELWALKVTDLLGIIALWVRGGFIVLGWQGLDSVFHGKLAIGLLFVTSCFLDVLVLKW